MHRNKQIAIILPDTLQSIGLQSMLTDYFPPVEISHYPTFEAFSTSGNDTFDYYFTNAALFVLYADFFLPRRRGKYTAQQYYCKPDGGNVRGWVTHHENNIVAPDRKSTRLNSSHVALSRMPSSA